MKSIEDPLAPNRGLHVRTRPEILGAGVPFSLTLLVVPDEREDPRALAVDIVDDEGQLLATTGIAGPAMPPEDPVKAVAHPEGAFATRPVTLTAPAEPGALEWRAVLRDAKAPPGDGASHPLGLATQAHALGLSVWDVPQALHPGQDFAFKVGLSCADGCATAAWTVEIRDAGNAPLCAIELGQVPLQGTDGLHYAEVLAKAPDTLGPHRWAARAIAPADAPPHQGGTAQVRMNVTPAPEFRLRVEVVDAASGKPIPDARVVAHPYRALADENGVAELQMHGGDYRLFVSGPSHIARRFDTEISGDVELRLSLAEDVGFTDADLW